MPSRKHLLFLLLVSLPVFSHAQVVINEILYSPSTKQWIEIYNNTNSPVDITQYKILDAGAAVNGHSISAITGGGNIIPAHEYGVVAKDITSVTANYLFKASLGIKTSGDTLTFKSGSNVIDTTSFPNNATASGNSWQKFDTGFQSALPTPGLQNVLPISNNPTNDQSSDSTSTDNGTAQSADNSQGTAYYSSHYSFVPISNAPEQKFTVNVGRNRLGFVGLPLKFKAVANTADSSTYFSWTFGDGSKDEGREVDHTYNYPGDYVIVLNASLIDNEAVSRADIKIVTPKVSVKEITPEYISVLNASAYEINLYGWKIAGGNKSFEFPKDTIVKSGATVLFPRTVTGISASGDEIILVKDSAQLTTSVLVDKGLVISAPDPAREKTIAEVKNKLLDLESQLATVHDFDPEPVASVTSTPVPETASAIEALPAPKSSWVDTIKHFFLRNK